jgi:hypothetical protein
VGASTRNGSKANYSNYGDTVDIAAPGGQNTQILSTTRNSFTSYGNMSGTSMASPHVAGAAAVVLSDDPTLTPHEVRSLLETTGDDIFSQNSWQSATKILRANMASALAGTVGVYPTINITSPNDGDSVTEDFVIIADASSAAGISAVLWYMDGEYLGKSSSAPYELNVGVVTLIPGTHLFTAEAIDNANMRNYSSVNITIALDPTATPYWTTVEDPPYTDGWISLNYSGSGSWQVVGTGDEEVYLGDPNKAGGPGYYVDDVDGLLSPNFDLRNMTDPYFAFEASWNLGANVYLFVRIVDSSGANDIIGAQYGSNNTWPERALFSIPLTDYAGNIARIEFWIQPYTGAAEGGGVYLDNFVVTQNSAPPVVNVLAPTSNAFETGNVSVIADVVDDLGTVLLVDLYEGSNLLFSTEVPPYTFDVDTTQLANGLHSFIVKAYDEMSVFGYAVAGSDSFGMIVHNTPPEVTLVSPTFATTSAPVTITGTGFGGYYSGGGGLEGPVYNYSHIYFTGTDGPIEAGVTEVTWTDTDITTTVPDGAVTGPITVEIGTLSFTTPDDFTVGAVGGMAFTVPSPKFLVTDPTQFIMTPQPFANSVEIRCAQVPGLFFVDSTPDDISFELSPAQFAHNGKYTLEATARSYAGDTTITFDFFVEKLQGDFDGNTYVEPADLTFLKSYVWLTPADDEWIPYLDWNKNGIIDEEDAMIVGYNFLAHN